MRGVNILVVFTASFISCCTAKKLPSFIQKCKRTDAVPDLSKCIAQRALFMKPYLIKGVPELNLPSIEPLHIPKFELHMRNTTAFRFDSQFTDIEVFGVQDFQIRELNFDLEKKTIFLHIYIPTLFIHGFYKVNGKILLFELASSGTGYGNVTDVEAQALTTILLETRNGKEYVVLQEDPTLYINYANPWTYFENLFSKNEELTKQVNKAINDNFKNLAEELNPLIYHMVRMLSFGIIKPIFSEYSLDELFD